MVCTFEYLAQEYWGLKVNKMGHGDTMVTHSPPTSEVGGSNPEPYMKKMVVSYQLLAVYSTEL